MTNELYQRMDELVNENTELTLKLYDAETLNGSLESANERLLNGLLTLTEKLKNANDEMGRLRMVRQRNQDSLEAIKQFSTQS
jgi:predicted nuclease with TOPRIM domain